MSQQSVSPGKYKASGNVPASTTKGQADDGFGSAVAISLNSVVVATGGIQRTAYILRKNDKNWRELSLPKGMKEEALGDAVAVNEGLVLVGAPSDPGSVYIFPEEIPSQRMIGGVDRLLPPEPDRDSCKEFGRAVAGVGKLFVVCASNAAYVFSQGTEYIQKLTRPSALDFGSAVAANEKDVAVAAQGAVYIFELTNWYLSESQEFTGFGDNFGSAVAINSDTLAVGAPQEKGIVYLFFKNASGDGWDTTPYKLTAPPAAAEGFGSSLTLDEDTLVVGSGSSAGAVCIYNRNRCLEGNQWRDAPQIILPKDVPGAASSPAAEFGSAVAVSDNRIVIGVPGQDIGGNDEQGAVYVFESSRNAFMRDNFDDTGAVPSYGLLCQSPDIIPKTEQVSNYVQAFGGANWDTFLGDNVEFGQDNYIYLRVHNPGKLPDNPVAHLFAVPASTLIHLQANNEIKIGELDLGTIAAGEKAVRGPIVWKAADIPAPSRSDHYCFVCYLTSAAHPFCFPKSFATADDFSEFVANNNNVCWRNSNVVDLVPTQERSFRFEMVGLPQTQATHQLKLSQTTLPTGSKLTIWYGNSSDKKTVTINGNNQIVLGERPLQPNEQVEVHVKLEPASTGEFGLTIAQASAGKVLGSVSYTVKNK